MACKAREIEAHMRNEMAHTEREAARGVAWPDTAPGVWQRQSSTMFGVNHGGGGTVGADLFGSLAEATCAALVVSATSASMTHTSDAIYFPLVITAAGVAVSFITIWFVNCWEKVDQKLFWQIIISTVLMSGAVVPALYMLPQNDPIVFVFGGQTYSSNPW